MRNVKLYRYSLPMEAGIILRHQRLKSRDGLLMCLEQDGKQGWGEVSPLPEFSRETLQQAESETVAWLKRWQNGETPTESTLPSVAFGISCALAELDGSLPDKADFRKAPLCSGDPDELLEVLNEMSGQKIAKVKVGLYEAVRDGMIVNMLLEAIPDLTLRLDANRSWTLAKAQGFAKYVSPAFRARIDFLEEPCKTPDESRQFAEQTGIAIAWDESVREEGFVVKAEPHLKAIVIKPSLVGSIDRCRQLIAQASQQGLTAVISSSIESSFALTQLARITAWLTPDTLPGLDTLDLMQAQLIRPWPNSPLPVIAESDLTLVWHS
jgi:O-succinylbenzoate synthase